MPPALNEARVILALKALENDKKLSFRAVAKIYNVYYCHEPTIKGGQVGRMGSSASQSFRGRSRGVASQVAQGDWLPKDAKLQANQRHSSTG